MGSTLIVLDVFQRLLVLSVRMMLCSLDSRCFVTMLLFLFLLLLLFLLLFLFLSDLFDDFGHNLLHLHHSHSICWIHLQNPCQ